MSASEIARRRSAIHEGTKRSTKQVLPDRDLIGVIAEQAFAKTYGVAMNMSITPMGDGGADFITRKGNWVDIKATKRPDGRLMVKKHRLTADIYVLAIVNTESGAVDFAGWTTKQDIIEHATREFHQGENFYCMAQDRLNRFT